MIGIEKHTATKWRRGCLSLVALIGVLIAGASCNKDFPNTLQKDFKNDTAGVTPKKAKVLYLILDGVRGKALKAIQAPNMTQIYKRSIYAFDALTDYEGMGTTNAGSWANMLTGVTRSKHNVTSEDFVGNKLAQYPSLFSTIKQSNNGKTRTAAYSATSAFANNLTIDATENKIFAGDDVGVKTALIKELENPDATLVLGEFGSAETAGKLSGYSDTNPAYVNTILKLDTYIGEIMAALAKRKSFADENWLVVVASNKGGVLPPDPSVTDKTVYADDARNSFIVFYNPRFATNFIPKPDSDKIPFSGVGPRLAGNVDTKGQAVLGNDAGLYNFGTTGEYTVDIRVKINSTASNYPTILGKRESFTIGKPGWVFFLEGDIWQLNVGRVGAGNVQANGGKIRDGYWHTLTAKFYKDGSTRKAKVFTDGVLKATIDITAWGSLDSPAPLTLGYINDGGGQIDVSYSNLQIFNVPVADEVITANSRRTVLNPGHPNINNLIGYWPLDEGIGTVMFNKSTLGAGKNFNMVGNAVWSSFSDYSPNLDAVISDAFFKIVPNNVDIPFHIYQWLGVPAPSGISLEGKLWKTTFTDLKLPY
ncbi:LamG-like jellyroll fold domain-containing protein [Pedobacter sp. PACM 27299]|uniref:LamG-like jellyroll fold domain-containing protein n=1 Tax=Pedobacter sp. PACM 27299 TaxID=1727164 RepID=UPI000AF74453|nr:LamG-like jellyroll fold domain-containing protein [Pedobacter sp. PACM 27299]